ncbi:MAG: NUDIX domain-containing protein [Prolixibacteraceae bacterium]|nr:NUDIX domain-containing protein [Burkholderiales bacterium]
MKKISAGILLYRMRTGTPEVFLVHPGGPFWVRKDVGAWSIPKGESEGGADLLDTAKREFFEETGSPIDGKFVSLTPLKQRSGKLVHAWAVEGDIDAASVRSNTFSMEWPPRSGKQQEFPEVDKGGWFTLSAAREKLLAGQLGFLDELETKHFPPSAT